MDKEIVCAFCSFTQVVISLRNFGFAPKFNSLEGVLMPRVGVISLHFKFISGLTNVLLKSFIWKKSQYMKPIELLRVCATYTFTHRKSCYQFSFDF